ncbi:serine hydrolase domain-containing protein [Pseudomarimonas salicorniae]|uniref:Beta-lactamase family protein n=1 Tax=Pseudomarimonas salicorniae TaxID=2933270 RepID=A0ABT0GG70_9GAMM|nr:serine hydrolase [Lysobacter sp. CAU 1642]MCK7593539.1 beta-lactamase family protein [Lysobacter sp. CAU 1642]
MRTPLSLLMACALSWSCGASELDALAGEVSRGDHRDVDAVLLSRDGTLLISAQRPRLRWRGIDIRSATKSVTALLVGIAIDRGHIQSVEVPVRTLLPELAESFEDPQRARITLADLLTMRSGLDCDDWTPGSPGHEDTMYETRDWLGFWSAVPMREAPGERFSYCTGNVIALGRLLAHATGKPVPEFAREALFQPLGIDQARWASWNRGRDTDTGGHLAIAPEGLLAIGQLVLDGGVRDGRQVVSRAWIEAMTTAHADIPGRPQRYGYLWWIDATRNPALPGTRLQMAWGNGGNFLVVMPELDAVYVSVGRRYNRPEAMEPLRWLGERILLALGASAAAPD